MTNATVEQVQMMCSCNFNVDNIVEEVFSCRASTMDPNLEKTVVYRAKVTPQLPVSVTDANDIVHADNKNLDTICSICCSKSAYSKY